MNILYSILYAALTVVLALAPFGVLLLKSKKITYIKVLLSFLWVIIVNQTVTGYLFYIRDYSLIMYYLYYAFWIFVAFGPFITRKILGQPSSIPYSLLTGICLFFIFMLSSFLLIPLGIGSLSNIL